MKENNINTGLDLEKQEFDLHNNKKRLMVGAVSQWNEIKPNADWTDVWLSLKPETQFGSRIETMGCTGYATANVLEMIWKWQYGKDINLSDRAINKMSGTTQNGNSVDAPIDTIRNLGYLFEDEYPWNRDTFDWNDYYATISTALLNKAKSRSKTSPTREWDFEHEYISTYNKDDRIKALKTSPIVGTVPAWYKGNDGKYYDYGKNVNHLTVAIVAFKLNDYWLAGDTYPDDFQYNDNPQQPEFLKKLDWNFRFGCLKRYKITPVINSKKKISLLILFKNMQDFLWSYSDNHGVYFYFVKKLNDAQAKIANKPIGTLCKQFMDISKLPDELSFLKGLAIILGEIKATRQTSWAEISTIPDYKFF